MLSNARRALITILLASMALASGTAIAKVGLESLTKQQQQEVWKSTRNIARIDAILAACDTNTNLERRIVAAVKRCVRPNTLNSLRAYWRKQKAKYAKELGQLDCKNEYMQKESKRAIRDFDKLVRDVRDQCRRCPIFIC